jgi:hypothetical protein
MSYIIFKIGSEAERVRGYQGIEVTSRSCKNVNASWPWKAQCNSATSFSVFKFILFYSSIYWQYWDLN